MELILCVSQQENVHPYRFSGTGIHVYSFEEVLYHVYHHWKQSVDDISSPTLAAWVHDALGLTFYSSKIKELSHVEAFSERMLAFLGITPYFNRAELDLLKPELERWEKRLEWETYKERADELVTRGEPDKAILLYRRALAFGENIPILNNLSIAYMQIEAYDEACRYFEQALKLDSKLASRNQSLILHYSEALIAARRFEEAQNTIDQVSKAEKLSAEKSSAEKLSADIKSDILYLKGELAMRTGQYSEAVSYFEDAIKNSPVTQISQYVFRLSDIYIWQRQFEKALEILNLIPDKETNLPCLIKEAELYNLASNLPGAINTIKKATKIKPGDVELWVRLARYHRLDYDLENAEVAIEKALSLDGGNERARLESARIKKGMGNTKAYQHLLKGILVELKGRYREVN